jgi:hypothetical protein
MPQSLTLPDPATCKTKHVISNKWLCLVGEMTLCNHRYWFGNTYFCNHANNHHYDTNQPWEQE